MIDWKDPKRTDVIHFKMVDPNDLDTVYGDIDDVQLGSSSIIYGYYADTRYSSQITFLRGNNYVENMWIRIVHEVPSEGYVNELGTFIPTSPNVDYAGVTTITYNLQSPLWGITDNFTTANFSIGKNTSYLDGIRKVCSNCNRPYIFENPNDYKSQKGVVYEPGTSYIDILYDLADASNNRIDLDGHGRIVLSPFVEMATVSPSWELDVDDPRGMVIQGSMKMEPEAEEIPNRTIVISGKIVGFADLPEGTPYSALQRGFVKAKTYSESNVKNKSSATSKAQKYLDGFSKITHWTMDTLYFPAKCGETVIFTIEGVKHICMIQSIDPVNLDTMTMTITLKEVN